MNSFTESTFTSLESAVATGQLMRDVRRHPVPGAVETVTATYRAVGRCRCGTFLPIQVVVRRKGEPAIVSSSVCGERCPDCDAALDRDSVKYLGIAGPGWPWIATTAISTWDLSMLTGEGNERSARE